MTNLQILWLFLYSSPQRELSVPFKWIIRIWNSILIISRILMMRLICCLMTEAEILRVRFVCFINQPLCFRTGSKGAITTWQHGSATRLHAQLGVSGPSWGSGVKKAWFYSLFHPINFSWSRMKGIMRDWVKLRAFSPFKQCYRSCTHHSVVLSHRLLCQPLAWTCLPQSVFIIWPFIFDKVHLCCSSILRSWTNTFIRNKATSVLFSILLTATSAAGIEPLTFWNKYDMYKL